MTRAVAARRLEFLGVRSLAREALCELGIPPEPLLPDHERVPVWPRGVVGSLTHSTGWLAAALALDDDVLAIGIDTEPNLPLPAEVRATVPRPREQAMLAELAQARPEMAWDRLLFSAKESAFKAWYPRTRRWLDFGDCEVDLDASGGFAARLLPAEAVPDVVFGRGGLCGRWGEMERGGTSHLATAVVVKRLQANRHCSVSNT